jgi:DNA-binding response OmpR family regulator
LSKGKLGVIFDTYIITFTNQNSAMMNNEYEVINLDLMLLFVFDSFDKMTFIRTEANKDVVPIIFQNNLYP